MGRCNPNYVKLCVKYVLFLCFENIVIHHNKRSKCKKMLKKTTLFFVLFLHFWGPEATGFLGGKSWVLPTLENRSVLVLPPPPYFQGTPFWRCWPRAQNCYAHHCSSVLMNFETHKKQVQRCKNTTFKRV